MRAALGWWVLVLVGLTLLTGVAAAAPAPPPTAPTQTPTVELVTVGPADALFSRWGHTGLRVQADGEDLMYSFGYASRGGLGQLIALLQGQAQFRLATRPWPKALAWYQEHDRQVEAQTLDLPDPQLRTLVQRLRINALKENRDYLYDALRDNCSTRLRDLLDDVAGGALRRAADTRVVTRTIRDDTRSAAAGSLPLEVGIELLVGEHQDTVPSAWEAMYRPLDLQQTVAQATLADGTPLAGPIRVVHVSTRQPVTRPTAGGWLLVLVGPFTLALAWATRRPSPWATRIAALLTALLGLLSGVLGLLICIAMSIAVVPSLSWNENCLVFVPLDLAAVGLAVRWLRGTRAVGTLGRLGLRYVGLRLAVLGGLLVAKLAGLSGHDNGWVILAVVVALAALLVAHRVARPR